MGKQKLITPDILPCKICGARAVTVDWNFDYYSWVVMCDNNHTATKTCGSKHRAICLWNNRNMKGTEN